MSSQQVAHGWLRGTGAAINVECGFIPDEVFIQNVTDGTPINIGFPSQYWSAFTSGGVAVLNPGATITGATSGATAKVLGVILDTGTFAGGDAAGWIIVDFESITGTWQAENADASGVGTVQTNVMALTAAPIPANLDIDTEVASSAGNDAVIAYGGSEASNAKGFTVGLTISVDAKLLKWRAIREGSHLSLPSGNTVALT